MQNDTTTQPAAKKRFPAWTTSLIGLCVFVVVLFWLHRLLGEYHWRDVVASVQGIPRHALLRAAGLAAAGYGCLSLYEMLGVNFAGARLPIGRMFSISLMAYGIGHTFGTNTLSGGAIRSDAIGNACLLIPSSFFFHFLLSWWKRQDNFRPSPVFALNAVALQALACVLQNNFAAMVFHDLSDDRQP